MLSNTSLPHGPLYDPESKVLNFKFAEDFENIRFNLLGTNTLYSDPNFHYYLKDDKRWRRPKEICARPHFIKGKPERFDALQGYLGDCWVVVAVEALTLNKKLFDHVVPPDQSFDRNYIGAFHFRLWNLGAWYDVVVDDRLPVWAAKLHELCYTHSRNNDIFWACLLEKAFAKFYGGGYEDLAEGYAIAALQDLSGGIIEKVLTNDPPHGTTIKWFLSNIWSNDAFLCCGFLSDDVKGNTKNLLPNHIYNVTNVFQLPDDDPVHPGLFLVRIMNPYGFIEWEGKWSDGSRPWRKIDQKIRDILQVKSENDGEFWMDDSDFIKYFKRLYVCHLGPGQYSKSRHRSEVNTWKTSTFWGQWKKNISAGGSDIKSRHQNPQFMISLALTQNDTNGDGLCSVVIELIARAKFDRMLRPNTGVYIYSLTNISNPPMPLDYNYIKNNKSLNENDFDPLEKKAGAFVTRKKLKPGKYCLIPCTNDRNIELEFLLRVFSESHVEMWEYDGKISKSLPLDEEILTEPNFELKNMFHDAASDRDEIDWIGLNNILGKAMNSNTSLFVYFKTFLKPTWRFFETFLPLPSIDGLDKGEIVFTKDDCRSMISMFDDNRSGKLSYTEFSNLWNKISFWTKVYEHYTKETGEDMPVDQLRDALSSAGCSINQRILHTLISSYKNEQETISLQDFIICGVHLEAVISLYQKKYAESEDKITFTLEEWVKHTLNV